MLVNELSYYELKRIIEPVIRLQKMSQVVTAIGTVLGIKLATREKILKQGQFIFRYKGFDLFLSDLRWLRGRGPCISLQLRRPATKIQTFLYGVFIESERIMSRVMTRGCGEVIDDLKTICLCEMGDSKLTTLNIKAYQPLGKEEFVFRATFPRGVFNYAWKEGRDISPLMITDELHSSKWFITFSFNAGCFIRSTDRTILREKWQVHADDVTKSITAEAHRIMTPHNAKHKTFEEWSEDMILDFGDEILPSLTEIWERINKD